MAVSGAPGRGTTQASLHVLEDIGKDLPRRVLAGGAGDAAARMGSGAAQVQPVDRRAVLRPAEDRPHREQLIERRLAVKDVPAGQPVGRLEIARA